MWCDQAKSVWSRSILVFIFPTNCMHHFYSYILQKTPLKLVNWVQRYEQLKDTKNNRKQKTFSVLFGSILKSIFPTSDWFCLITSQITKWWAKFKLECLLLICTYTNEKFIVICKPRTLNDGGEESVKYRNRKKAPLPSSSHYMHFTIAYSKIKKRNLVLINNDTYQRETLSERPIR